MGGSLRKVHVQGSRQNSDIEFRAMNRLAIDLGRRLAIEFQRERFRIEEIKRTRMSDVFSVPSGALATQQSSLPSVASAFGHTRKPPPYVGPTCTANRCIEPCFEVPPSAMAVKS